MTNVLSPWTLDSLSLRNRIVMAPVKTAFGTPEGRKVIVVESGVQQGYKAGIAV